MRGTTPAPMRSLLHMLACQIWKSEGCSGKAVISTTGTRSAKRALGNAGNKRQIEQYSPVPRRREEMVRLKLAESPHQRQLQACLFIMDQVAIVRSGLSDGASVDLTTAIV